MAETIKKLKYTRDMFTYLLERNGEGRGTADKKKIGGGYDKWVKLERRVGQMRDWGVCSS